MDYQYFTKQNPENIYIEHRGGHIGAYAVYDDQSCVFDVLNKKQAIKIANQLYKGKKNETLLPYSLKHAFNKLD